MMCSFFRDILFGCMVTALFFAAACSVKCTELTKADLDSALVTPQILTDPGEEYADRYRTSNMNAGIARTPNGRLWACWISGENGKPADTEHALLLAARSDDDGTTWSKPCLAIDPKDSPNGIPIRVLIANFWTDPRGRLWLFFDVGLGSFFDGRMGLWVSRCDDPDAEEPVWTVPKRIYDGAFHNKILVTHDGRWLLPAELYPRDYSQCGWLKGRHSYFPELDPIRGVTILETTDDGETWTPIGRAHFPVNEGEEPILIENPDHSLRLFARTPLGMYESRSADGGKTWSESIPSYKNPVTRFLIMRLRSGNLLFVRHGVDGEVEERDQLRAWISSDEGKTWRGGMYIDSRTQVAYPDGIQASDGKIYVTYEHGRDTDAEILLDIFTEEDVLHAEETPLRRLVNKAGKLSADR